MQSEAILITGAAIRVGKAVALHLAQQGYGIAIHYRQSESDATALAQEVEALGSTAALVQADFSTPFDAEAVFEKAAKKVGTIRHLINNASAFHKDTLHTIEHEQFMEHMQVNLYAPLRMIRAFVAQLSGAAGSIINITDGTKGWSLSSRHLSYALSKTGLMHLTDMLAVELAPQIRINNVAPGPSLPGLLDDDETFARLAQRAPLNRVSSPQEVCDAIGYLMRAPSVTGQTIWLGGGLQCHQAIDIAPQ